MILERLVANIFDKCLLPRTLQLVVSELEIELPVRFSVDTAIRRGPISFAFIGIIKSRISTLVNAYGFAKGMRGIRT